nr:tetratricopeptide repeat protein [Shimia biformata]
MVLTLSAGQLTAEGLSGAYLAGRQASYNSDFAAAAEYYTQALARDPGNVGLMESAVLSFLALGEVEKALPIARHLEEKGADSQLASMVLAAGLVSKGDYDALIARMNAEKGVGPLVDGLMTAWAHVGSGQMSEALAAFQAVGSEPGLIAFSSYHQALALASVGDFEGAAALFEEQMDNGLQLTQRGAWALVEIYSQLDRRDDAISLLDGVFGAGLNPELNDIRARLEAGETLPFTQITSAKDGLAEVFFSIASALEHEANADYTLLYARVAEFLRPDHFDALILSAGLLEELGRFELATEAYRRVPPEHPSYYQAELGRADALRRSDRNEAAIEVLEQLARSHSGLSIVHSSLGDVLRGQKEFARAAAAYDTAIGLIDEGSPGLWFLHYARGISHERLDDWDRAEADFRAALELNPDQPQVLNYLGYSLVEKQIKLDEALDMIERAVAAQPQSGYIVDSLGWVLYRLGRYDEAVDHMERAVELMPIDPVVNDHLGDVYWAVGRKLEAAFQWRRALSFVDAETAEEAKPDRIRRKLDVGLDQVLEEEGAAPLKVANEG